MTTKQKDNSKELLDWLAQQKANLEWRAEADEYVCIISQNYRPRYLYGKTPQEAIKAAQDYIASFGG